MNGMQYMKPRFMIPASTGEVTPQRRWDYATMKKDAFIAKYGEYCAEPLASVTAPEDE